eukprot:COSAG05_NODE_645_length_8126_cov_2.992276_3_plen_103_part_00
MHCACRGSQLFAPHAGEASSHAAPMKSSGQSQPYDKCSSTQFPSCKHGLGGSKGVPLMSKAQSFTTSAHVSPEKPRGHMHEKPLVYDVHVAPLWQGWLAHSL